MRNYFPIFLDLANKTCLLVGGGNLAFSKAESLLQAGARVRVVAPELGQGLRGLLEAGRLTWTQGLFEPDQLEGVFMLVAATDQPQLHAQLFRLAEDRNLLFNAVDEPGHCNFILPARVSSGPIQVAVSSSGASPTLAGWLRDQIREQWMTPALGALAEYLESWRPEVKKRLGHYQERKLFWRRVIESDLKNLVEASNYEAAHLRMTELLAQEAENLAAKKGA